MTGRDKQPLRCLRTGVSGVRPIHSLAERVPLIAASLVLCMPLLDCSHSASSAYSVASQPGSALPPGAPVAATAVAPSPPGYAANPAVAGARPAPSYSPPAATVGTPPSGYASATVPVSPPSPPPDEYDQAVVSAYPSVSLADVIRHSSSSSPPPPPAAAGPTAAPPIALQVPPNIATNGVPTGYSAAPPYPPPGSAIPASATAPSYGTAAAPPPTLPPQPDYDQALTSAYPSESLGDLLLGRSASH